MRKTISFFVLFLLLGISGVMVRPACAQAKKPSEPLTLKVGDTAPDFTLLAFDGKDLKKVSLSDFRGKKNVALAFYVFAFTGG
jgi:AhpC/TSA family